MNDFGFTDYKKPLGIQNDMRTSTYMGNVHMTDTMLATNMHIKMDEQKAYDGDPVLDALRVCSDYKWNYTYKFPNPNEIKLPSISNKNILLMKPFEECKLKFLKREMQPLKSVSHENFTWQPMAEKPVPKHERIPSPVAQTKIVIDRSKPGYTKYLDPAATTHRLDYVSYTPFEIMASVAANDNITFWNWDPVKSNIATGKIEEMCDGSSSNDCKKRHCEFTSLVKRVPNSGMTTEVRENYLPPYQKSQEYDINYIRNKLVYFPIIPFAKKTEYTVYGSGERTQLYV